MVQDIANISNGAELHEMLTLNSKQFTKMSCQNIWKNTQCHVTERSLYEKGKEYILRDNETKIWKQLDDVLIADIWWCLLQIFSDAYCRYLVMLIADIWSCLLQIFSYAYCRYLVILIADIW